MPQLVPIVEGDGETEAVPLLLRQILAQNQWWEWSVAHPKKAGSLPSLKNKLERFLRYAQMEPDCGGVLILLDLDDGCPKEEACRLAERIRRLNQPHPVAVVLAHREYEAWFLASLETIAGNHNLPPDLRYDQEVEGKRGVKEWLTAQMPPGQSYKPTIHQAKLTNLIDLDIAAQRSRSFRRLCQAVQELVNAPPPDAHVTPRKC